MHISPGSHDAANLMLTTIQTARRKFCSHSVVDLKEANCDQQVWAARGSVEQHMVRPEENCQVCNSSLQEEVKALLTNRIIPALEKTLCVGCRGIHAHHGDPMELCNTCHTAFRISLSMLIAVAGMAPRCPVGRV